MTSESGALKKTTLNPELKYLSGFGNHHQSEAETGALPRGQNSPQKVPYGLYTEQLSGTSFNAARHENQRSWLYRIRPSVSHLPFRRIDSKLLQGRPFKASAEANQMRWRAITMPDVPRDFLDGLVTICGNGDKSSIRGCAVHMYAANRNMDGRILFDADGEFLILPQEGGLRFRTEFGIILAEPGEMVVIPVGVKFQVELLEQKARGYVLENYGPHFRLPNLGVIGANGLANARDFLYPVASYEDKSGDYQLIAKFGSALWSAEMSTSPLDVVAWHGNYAPFKYDLKAFQAINSVSYDHPDPSIFTVLTSPSEIDGTANVDFAVFPNCWSVAEHTFRPPYFHRNIMSEFMGLIAGTYAGKEGGFAPGGASLHNCMLPHGPDLTTYERAIKSSLVPEKIDNTLAFLFESSLIFEPTEYALTGAHRDMNYAQCWQGFKSQFAVRHA